MSLNAKLAVFRRQFREKCADKTAVIERAIAALETRLQSRQLFQAGDIAPDFSLPATTPDGAAQLKALLRQGPVVLTFYRGGWCPYCTLELRAYAEALPRIQALGASVLAVSPQLLEHARVDVQRHGLGYPVASDQGGCVARAYGIDYQLPEELRRLYARLDHPLPPFNGDDEWLLLAPATFVIAADSRIALAHAEADHRQRLEPAEAIAVLAGLAGR